MAPAAADHFCAVDLAGGPFGLDIFDAHGLFSVKKDSIGKGPADHGQVGAVFDRVQVGPCGAQASAPVDIAVECPEAFLAVAVDILRQGIPRLLDRLQESAEEGVFTGSRFKQAGGR